MPELYYRDLYQGARMPVLIPPFVYPPDFPLGGKAGTRFDVAFAFLVFLETSLWGLQALGGIPSF